MTIETETTYPTATPYLVVPGVDQLIVFAEKSFDAEETFRVAGDDGRVVHVELRISNSQIMAGEPESEAAMPTNIYLRVDDVDERYRKALEAGGKSMREPADQEYGERMAGVKDPTGNIWWLAKPV